MEEQKLGREETGLWWWGFAAILRGVNRFLLLVGLGGLAMPVPPENLEGVVGLAWQPHSGTIEVLCDNGKTIASFNVLLQPIGTRATIQASANPSLDIAGPSSKRIHWHQDRQLLEIGMAPWERVPEVEFGPGWATVRFRCSRSLGGYLEWRDAGGAIQHANLHVDPTDPMTQRAFLYGIQAGQEIAIRHLPHMRCFPALRWTRWKGVRVPKVSAAGIRPVILLP